MFVVCLSTNNGYSHRVAFVRFGNSPSEPYTVAFTWWEATPLSQTEVQDVLKYFASSPWTLTVVSN